MAEPDSLVVEVNIKNVTKASVYEKCLEFAVEASKFDGVSYVEQVVPGRWLIHLRSNFDSRDRVNLKGKLNTLAKALFY